MQIQKTSETLNGKQFFEVQVKAVIDGQVQMLAFRATSERHADQFVAGLDALIAKHTTEFTILAKAA